jgi:hypothetical protein
MILPDPFKKRKRKKGCKWRPTFGFLPDASRPSLKFMPPPVPINIIIAFFRTNQLTSFQS